MGNQVAERKEVNPTNNQNLTDIWSNPDAFQTAMRMAKALSSSTIVPKDYQGEKGLGNSMIALEMANRLKTSPLMVMQNLYVVNGRPAWSSQYIIAMINNSKKYKTEIQFEMKGKGDTLECTAYVEDYSDRVIKGPKITMEMAKAEGWVSKSMSKWKTMPEVMIRYRAASFFGRLNCPDMIMGLYSVEEAKDMDADFKVVDAVDELNQEVEEHANKIPIDLETGEIKENQEEKKELPESTETIGTKIPNQEETQETLFNNLSDLEKEQPQKRKRDF
jgi:hypothetical protein